jgi:hypothetical protein
MFFKDLGSFIFIKNFLILQINVIEFLLFNFKFSLEEPHSDYSTHINKNT